MFKIFMHGENKLFSGVYVLLTKDPIIKNATRNSSGSTHGTDSSFMCSCYSTNVAMYPKTMVMLHQELIILRIVQPWNIWKKLNEAHYMQVLCSQFGHSTAYIIHGRTAHKRKVFQCIERQKYSVICHCAIQSCMLFGMITPGYLKFCFI